MGQLYIAQLNVQSIKPKLLELRQDIAEHGYDVVVLCETWLKPSTDNRLIPVPGYQLLRRDRADGRGYGGVAVLVKDSFSATVMEGPDQVTAGSKLESLWVRIRAGQQKVVLCSLYRPPIQTQARVSADLDELEQQLQHTIARHSGPIILAGDINIHTRGNSTAATRLAELLAAYSMQQHISGPTFRSSGSTIDMISTNRGVERAGTLHCDFSPHVWSRVLMSFPDMRPAKCTLTGRNWRKMDMSEANRHLRCVDWSPVFHSADPGEQWSYFLSATLPIIDRLAPVKRVQVRNPTAPPVTAATKDLMTRRRAALRTSDRDLYKDLNRQVRSAVRRDTREEIGRRIQEGGPSSTWSSVRPVISGKRPTRSPPDADVNAVNQYFASIGTTTARQVDSAGPELAVRLPRVATGRFQVAPVTPGELRGVIGRMKNSTSCGADGLCVRFIKQCIDSLCHVITHIVNSSLTNHTVPDSWKLALVHPIQKTAKSTDVSNYRPISILPTIAKITERVVYEQLFSYFTAHHLFSSSQHGFRMNHSTDTALITVTERVFEAMDKREITLLCLLDLSKCFDLVPHEGLLRKLELYNVDTRWFMSYLTGHYQQVVTQTPDGLRTISAALPNPIGTYQGSALGPLLYSIYANDMPLYADDATIVQYADDTQVLVSGRPGDIRAVTGSLERNLSHLSNWFGKNGMKINAQKTQLIVLGTPQNLRQLPSLSIKFMGATVSGSPTVRNLGVQFDQGMTFASHTDNVVRRCTGILIGLSHSRHSLPHTTLLTLVQSLVISLLRYCISVYGVCNATQTARLQKVLNFAARVVSGRRKFDHVSDVLRDLEWLTAHNMYVYHALTLLKRVLVTSQPESLSASLVRRRHLHGRTTRQDDMLNVPAIRSESGRRRFLYSVVTAFNDLPQDIRDLNLHQFKVEVRKRLLAQQITDR